MVTLIPFADYVDWHQPRRLRKYILIWCWQGAITLVVDEQELTLPQHHLVTITSGQYHYVRKAYAADGFILEFSLDFFCKNDNDIELIFHNGLFCHFSLNEVIAIDRFEVIQTQLEQIGEEVSRKPYQYLVSVHARIELLLIEINRAKVEQGHEIWKPDALFLKFLELVRHNLDQHLTLTELAEQLNTTEAKLNEQAKLHTGRTAQSVIYGLIVSEAKRLLTYQNLTVKEVAYQLGFNDPFYFSNFFKKHTQLSPKAYQSQRT